MACNGDKISFFDEDDMENKVMKKAPKNFEEALARLENITRSMQNPETPLEDALKYYEEGCQLVVFCRDKLAEVEQKLQILDQDKLKEFALNES